MTVQATVEQRPKWTAEQQEAVELIKQTIQEKDIKMIRIAWADQHGVSRAKTVTTAGFDSVMEKGMDFNTGPLFFDTANVSVYNVFDWGGGVDLEEMTGVPNYVLKPDPLTFRVLPWAPNTGWILCDAYLKTGEPLMFDSRQICKRALDELNGYGYDFMMGLEVEWVLTKIEDEKLTMDNLGGPGFPSIPPKVSPVSRGYQYQLEAHNDEIDGMIQILVDNILQLGLPLLTIEDEFGPSQVEFTFGPMKGIQAADAMLMMRTAVKQICRRHGYIASFMCRPVFKGMFANGWHMHQSLIDIETGENAFIPKGSNEQISQIGKHFIGGLLKYARPATVFTTPTINGYKRFKEYSLAPDRAGWGNDNRGTMIRVLGGAGIKSTHFENRVGESAANPYLYMASQIFAGLEGIKEQLDPGPMSVEAYNDQRDPLPKSLEEAIEALKNDGFYRQKMGSLFIDYIIKIKEHEVTRYKKFLEENNIEDDQNVVTEWEHREYFEIY